MNIVDPILHQCRINGEQPAICASGTTFDLISYAQLEYMINNLMRSLLPFGFEPGQIIGVLLQDKIFHVALLLALTRMNLVTVSCSTASLPPEIGANAPALLNIDPTADIMGLPLREARDLFETQYLQAQLVRFGGNISRTAQFVGMERSALHRKLKQLGVNSEEKVGG